ncbi:hypothetical protein VNO77_40280 [Canavalia gladiata]|uniref:Uncharacterized protein n=1 Tax=Canavalia gladiata TaxID=3824 RepID=A0AAN9K0I6_CANGL
MKGQGLLGKGVVGIAESKEGKRHHYHLPFQASFTKPSHSPTPLVRVFRFQRRTVYTGFYCSSNPVHVHEGN